MNSYYKDYIINITQDRLNTTFYQEGAKKDGTEWSKTPPAQHRPGPEDIIRAKTGISRQGTTCAWTSWY